jgi:hypothetical protein
MLLEWISFGTRMNPEFGVDCDVVAPREDETIDSIWFDSIVRFGPFIFSHSIQPIAAWRTFNYLPRMIWSLLVLEAGKKWSFSRDKSEQIQFCEMMWVSYSSHSWIILQTVSRIN